MRDNNKKLTLVDYVACVVSTFFTLYVLGRLGLAVPSNDISTFLLQLAAYTCLFTTFNLLATRFFKWLYA